MASPVPRFSKLGISRQDLAYKLAATTENCYLTIDSKDTLTITNDPAKEVSCDVLIKRLIADLNELSLSKQAEFDLPKDTLKIFKERTITYFTKKKVPEDTPSYKALKDFHFPIAQLRWKYGRSIQKYEKLIQLQDLDYESKTAEKLLEQHFMEKMPKFTTEEDLDFILFPRDVLFMRKLITRYITEYTILQQEINDLILSKFVHKVIVISTENSDAVFFGDNQLNQREQRLQEKVREASIKLISYAADKGKFCASIIRSVLRNVHEYQKLADHNPVFFEECVETLALNERISRLKKLDYKWKSISFSVRGFINPEFVPFKTVSYLLKRHLYFIYNLTSTYRARVEVIDDLPLEERVQQHCMLAQFYRALLKADIEFKNVFATLIEKNVPVKNEAFYKILAKTLSKDDVELYTLVANAITGHARIIKNDRLSNLGFSQVIPVVSDESDEEGDNSFEEYTWTKTSAAQYAHSDSKLKKLEHGINLATPQILIESSKEAPIRKSSPTGFIDDLKPIIRPKIQRTTKKEQKRKKAPSPPASTTPEEVDVDPIQNLCEEVAKVSLQPRTKSPETKKIKPVAAQTCSPLVLRQPQPKEVSAHLKYDPRVTRWNREKDILTTDPEYKESKFGLATTKVIYKEHNYTKYMDFYISLGTQDPKMPGRIQLYGEMIIVQNGKQERRLGTFTYTKDSDGLYFHRYFKAKGTETALDMPIDPVKAAKIWEILAKTPLIKDIPTKPQQITRDKGYLVSDLEGIITIMDPTTDLFVESSTPFRVDLFNHTLLRLVR